MYNSWKPTIISAINLLNTNPSFNGQSQSHTCHRRSLLPFLGDTLRWLMGTATTKDVNSIKTRKNQLLATQSLQQETLVHILSMLNIAWYAVQVNRHSINVLMDKVDKTSHDINNLYNLTTSLATSISSSVDTPHQVSVCKPLQFTQLYQNGFYTYHGLHQCSHIRNTISTHLTSNGSTKDAVMYRRNTTIDTTPACLNG